MMILLHFYDDMLGLTRPSGTTSFAFADVPAGVVFGGAPTTFRRWLHAWLKVLCSRTSGPLAFAFEACR